MPLPRTRLTVPVLTHTRPVRPTAPRIRSISTLSLVDPPRLTRQCLCGPLRAHRLRGASLSEASRSRGPRMKSKPTSRGAAVIVRLSIGARLGLNQVALRIRLASADLPLRPARMITTSTACRTDLDTSSHLLMPSLCRSNHSSCRRTGDCADNAQRRTCSWTMRGDTLRSSKQRLLG